MGSSTVERLTPRARVALELACEHLLSLQEGEDTGRGELHGQA